ncbi:MAG: hypothetical protein ACT4O2_03055 [Beijerinckiaceae bacterium]
MGSCSGATSGRQRFNIHGAIDLAAGKTAMNEAMTIDPASTIKLLESMLLSDVRHRYPLGFPPF